MRLEDVADINARSINSSFLHKTINYIDISAVGSGVLTNVTEYEITKAPGRARRLVSDGDTILSTVRPNRRSFLYIKNPEENTVASTGFVVLTPKKETDSRFLYYLVTRQQFTNYLDSNTKGSAYPAVGPEIITDAEVLVPELATQKRIAGILSAFDEKIENNNCIIKALEEMAQAIFKEWFIDFRFPGHEKTEFVDSELGKIPKGWGVKNVLDVVKRISVGKKFENKTTLPYGKVPILDQGQSGFIGYHNEEPGIIASIDEPVVVFTNHTCYYRLITYPFSAIQNVLPYVGTNGYPTLFAYYLTTGKITMQEYKGHWPEFEQQEFLVPPTALAEEYTDLIKPMIRKMVEAESEKQKLAAMRDLLLPRLMRGEIRV